MNRHYLLRLLTNGLFLLCVLVLNSSVKAQNPEWKRFPSFYNILCLAKEGNYVWVGLAGGGLARIDKTTEKYEIYHKFNSGLPVSIVWSMAIDENGVKWIGTHRGLAEFDGTNWRVFDTTNSGLPENRVLAIAIDKAGNKWIGTTGGGLAKFDGMNWTVYNRTSSGLSDTIKAIAIDEVGNVWVGTVAGLAKFDGTKWKFYTKGNSALPDNDVRSLCIDKGGNKWIGTYYGGLIKFDGVNWTIYNTSNSGLPNNVVLAIAIDEAGNKWLGTAFGGLAKFDDTSWTVYNKINSPLPDNQIIDIVIDEVGNKWLGTWEGGLAVFREGGVILEVDENWYEETPIPVNILIQKHTIYPNSGSILEGLGRFALFNTLGLLICDNCNDMDIRNLSNGVYFLRKNTRIIKLMLLD